MNGRNIIRSFLKGEKPDIPLVDLGGRVASFSIPAYLAFKKHIGLENILEPNETTTMLNTLAGIDERVFSKLEIPFRRINLGTSKGYHLHKEQDGSFLDEWGVKYISKGFYSERVENPLADATSKTEIDDYPWPDPTDPGRIDGLFEKVKNLNDHTEFTLVAGHISSGIFQDCWNMRGMQKFFEDMVINRKFAETLIEKITSIHIGLWKTFLSVVGNYVDIVETADDLGSQKSLLISPVLYRNFIKPFHSQLNQAIKKNTNAKILFHTCGAVMPLIEDFIEIGVDILNPIQPIKGLMEPGELRSKFGDRIIFHGGLDVQDLLINNTQEEIKSHVLKYFNILGFDRYIMAPTNTIQPNTPPENVLAAYRSACNATM
jgi:uroporphyrinogen decarboxylase